MVADVDAARAQLLERGVEASEVQVFPWGRFVFFSDPDGNGWALQEIQPARLNRSRRGQHDASRRAPILSGMTVEPAAAVASGPAGTAFLRGPACRAPRTFAS